jgi:hypothetical protein
MKINCSIDTSLTLGHYVFEASFWLKDWQLTAETYTSSAVRMLHLGPFCFCITDLKKLRAIYESKPQRISLDELLDL